MKTSLLDFRFATILEVDGERRGGELWVRRVLDIHDALKCIGSALHSV